MSATSRGTLLTVFALLFGLMAVSNLLKPLQLFGDQTAFVFFGARMSGTANLILGPLFGIFLAIYACGIWRMKRFAMPMGHAYAVYVFLNLVLWTFRKPPGVDNSLVFTAIYATIAIGVSLGAAVVLTQRKAELS